MPDATWWDNQRPVPNIAVSDFPEVPEPTFTQMMDAAWHQNNALQALSNIMTKPSFPVVENYPLEKRLKEEGLWEWDREQYVGVQSEEELLYRMQRLAISRNQRQTLAASGWAGVAAGVFTASISPTIFIPILGPAVAEGTAASAAFGAGSMLLAAGIDEGILYADQYDRTAADAAINIGAATVLGGILGSAASMLTRRELETLARDMINSENPRTTNYAMGYANPANEASGSAAATVDFSKLPGGFVGLDKLPTWMGNWLGPVVRGIGQERSNWMRWATGQFADAGMIRRGIEEGKIPALGGYIEDNVKTYNKRLVDSRQIMRDKFVDYSFDGAPPKYGARTRAFFGSLGRQETGKKMNEVAFRKEVFKAWINNDEHPIKQVADAAKATRPVFEQTLADAIEAGSFSELESIVGMTREQFIEKMKGDTGYASRVYNHKAIVSMRKDWMDLLTGSFAQKLMDEYVARVQKSKAAGAIERELAADLERPPHEVEQIREQLKAELQAHEDQANASLKETMDELQEAREARIELRRAPEVFDPKMAGKTKSKTEKLAEAGKRIKELKAAGGPAMREHMAKTAALNRRLRNLNKAEATMTEKQFKKLQRIERLDQLQLNTMNRVVRRGQKYLNEIRSLTDKEWAKRREPVLKMFDDAVTRMEKSEKRLLKAMKDEGDPDLDKLWDRHITYEKRVGRIKEVYKRLEELDTFDRPAWSRLIQEGLDEVLGHARDINAKRAVRAERLTEQAKNLDPAKVKGIVAELLGREKARAARLSEHYSKYATDIDYGAGTANFDLMIRDMAEKVTDKILGNDRRLPLNDIIMDERGPMMARMLDIPTEKLLPFLETDAERVMTHYIRTMAADTEIARKFKSPSASWIKDKIKQDERAAYDAVNKAVDAKGVPRSEEWKANERLQIEKDFRQMNDDLNVMLRRIRGIQAPGIDPRAVSTRAATAVRQILVLDQMNAVIIASVVDPGRIIQRYGLMRTMRTAIRAFTGGLKEIKMSAREAQLAGTALDWTLHTRSHSAYDIFDGLHYGTKAERGLEWLTSKVGKIGLFDGWTQVGKQISSIMENEVILESIATLVEGGSKKAVARATKELARRNIDEQTMAVIWDQVQKGGGGKINGTWLPETEAWDTSTKEVRDALRVYRAASAGTIDDVIVTPGVDRMSWTDSSNTGKMISQFHSFGFASTTRTLLAAMQEPDLKAFNGMMISVGLGMMGYYLSAVSKGGQAYEDMMNADIGKWIDEGIIRSGQLGMLEDVMRAAQRTPGLSDYASFSQTRSGRNAQGDLRDLFFGPSYDLADKLNAIIMSAHEPTKHTKHMIRQLVPFNNHFVFRQAFDALEDDIGP